MTSARPLDRFLLVNTSSIEEARDTLTRTYLTPKFKVVGRPNAFHAFFNLCELQHTKISYGSYAAAVSMRLPERSFATQVFLLAGKTEAVVGRRSETFNSDRALVISPNESIGVTHNSDYERLALSMNSKSLMDALSAITGKSCSKQLKFHPVQDHALPAARALRNHFLFLVETLTASAAPLPKLVLDEYEQTLMVMFLHANRHNYSHLLERTPPDSAVWQVRRAEDFIEANWQRAIRLEDLAENTGVSAFSLFRTFEAYRGYSPFAFLSQVRTTNERLFRKLRGYSPLEFVARLSGKREPSELQ